MCITPEENTKESLSLLIIHFQVNSLHLHHHVIKKTEICLTEVSSLIRLVKNVFSNITVSHRFFFKQRFSNYVQMSLVVVSLLISKMAFSLMAKCKAINADFCILFLSTTEISTVNSSRANTTRGT